MTFLSELPPRSACAASASWVQTVCWWRSCLRAASSATTASPGRRWRGKFFRARWKGRGATRSKRRRCCGQGIAQNDCRRSPARPPPPPPRSKEWECPCPAVSRRQAANRFGPEAPAGSNNRLETPSATLYLAQTSVVAAGPTSPTVTLNLALSFKPSAAGRTYTVEVAASDDAGHEDAFKPAGTLTVTP